MTLGTATEVESWVRSHGRFTTEHQVVSVDAGSLEVDIEGDYYLLPAIGDSLVRFRHAKGSFSAMGAGLTTLAACPRKVDGHFDCRANPLESYEHAPEQVSGLFVCDGTRRVLMLMYKTRMQFLVCSRNPVLAQLLRRHWKGFLAEETYKKGALWLQQQLSDAGLDDYFCALKW